VADRALVEAFAAALTARSIADVRLDAFAGDAQLVRRRFGLYRGNVRANVGRALAAAYPVVRQLVGDEFFDALGREYARAQPSTGGDLNAFGHAFAAFLADFPHVADLPYLPDVARLEWLAHCAHFAADAAPCDAGQLAAIPPERCAALVPRLHPACALMASPYPVATIWRVHQPEHAGEIAVDLDAGGERVLVYRPRWRVAVAALDAGAAAFLGAAARGMALGAALDAAYAADRTFAPDGALARFVADAVIVDFVEG